MLKSTARVYSNVCLPIKSRWWDYEPCTVNWSDGGNICLIKKIGEGTISNVFLARNVLNGDRCIVKCCKFNTDWMTKFIISEIKILQYLDGHENIISLLDFVKYPSPKVHAIVLECAYLKTWKDEHSKISRTIYDIAHFMNELLKALDYCHSMGIMHRDIKPSNVIVDYDKKKLKLIDFSIAEFYHPYRLYGVKVGTKSFCGPELLLNYTMYNYSIDIWAAGCMLAGLLFKKKDFFEFSVNTFTEQLVGLVKILGSNNFFKYLNSFSIPIDPSLTKAANGFMKRPWFHFDKRRSVLIPSDAYDLLDKLLCFDHVKRLTANEAMCHRFIKTHKFPVKI